MQHALSQPRTATRQTQNRLPWIAVLIAAATALLGTSQVDAANGLCADGTCRAIDRVAIDRVANDRVAINPGETFEQRFARFSNELAMAGLTHSDRMRRADLSDQEYFSFSGVGAVVCTINGKQRMSTAFLVGAFDLGVTVAHTFVDKGTWAQPEDCVYTTTDSRGQIRERIPVEYIKTQWSAETNAFGQLAKDFAVIRLVEPSRFAQRTMPLGKYSGLAVDVLMIGFKTDMATDTVKLKTRGTVYERKSNGITTASLAGFTHDMDARGIAAGAPVIDERTGVIIGVHTGAAAAQGRPARNTMIAMTDWLEATLRAEMQIERAARIH